MIDALDITLRELFKRRVPDLRHGAPPRVDNEQVGFQPPDEDWRTVSKGLGTRKSLNLYLVDLRENRRLRSNDPDEWINEGVSFREPPPARVECHYLISAWSNSTEHHGRTREEHRLLHQVMTALFEATPLVPVEVFFPASVPGGFPDAFAQAELPSTVVPHEGFPKLSEFWATMGATYHWKPTVYLVATVPVVFGQEIAGPLVTTLGTDQMLLGKPETADRLIQIGGRVLDTSGATPVPLANAWVRIEDAGGRIRGTTRTNSLGRFEFDRLRPGSYSLRYRAGARPEPNPRQVTLPSPSGEYDLVFP